MKKFYIGIIVVLLIIGISAAVFFLTQKPKELPLDQHPSGMIRNCLNVRQEAQNVCFDNAFMNYAINGIHPEYCDKVKDKELREECKDTLLLQKALNEDNIALCKTAFNITVCETLFYFEKGIRTRDPNVCNNIQVEWHKILCIDQASVYTAIFSNQEFKCENFKDEETKLTCLTNEVFTLVREQNNVTVCEQIKELTYREMCKQGYYTDKAVRSNDLSYCNNLETPQVCIDDYYFGKAQLENNLNLCENIADNLTKNDCYGRIV